MSCKSSKGMISLSLLILNGIRAFTKTANPVNVSKNATGDGREQAPRSQLIVPQENNNIPEIVTQQDLNRDPRSACPLTPGRDGAVTTSVTPQKQKRHMPRDFEKGNAAGSKVARS